MKKVTLLAPICLLLILTSLDDAAAQREGIIEGQVVNGTGQASPDSVAGLEVRLYDLTEEGQRFRTSTTTDEQGRFRFAGLLADDEHSYRFQLEYEGIMYSAESASLQGEAVLPVVITIYETTRGDQAIVLSRHHITIDFSADALLIKEMFAFNNLADTVYTGQEGSTLRFSLPADATDLRFDDAEMESNSVETDEGFASALPVAPGPSRVLFSYTLPYDGRGLTLIRKTLYPTTKFDLMVADVGVQGESEQLAYRGLTGARGTTYLRFEAQDLLANSEMEMQLSGSPQVTAHAPPAGPSLGLSLQRVYPWLSLGLAVLGALVPFAEAYRRGRPKVAPETQPSKVQTAGHADSELRIQRQELLQLIADLDDALAEGRIAREPYQELRMSMKHRLIDITLRSEENR
jgi:5-hydroxyisourate hydrolase-like protein (transthyretin family)